MDNAVEKLNAGDIVFYGDERFQILRPHAEIKTMHVAAYLDTTMARPIVRELPYNDFRRRCHPLDVQPGGQFNFGNTVGYVYLGSVTYAQRDARTMPVLFGGGELSADNYRQRAFRCLIEGDPKVYSSLSQDCWNVDLMYAAVVPALLAMPDLGDVSGFAKMDLMCYVLKVNGHLTRDRLMEKVAALERKPWVRTSNSDYFKGLDAAANAKAECSIVQAGKGPRGRILYGLGAAGEKRAAAVLARLGEGPGRL